MKHKKHYQDGRLDGLWESYYKSGQLDSEGYYKGGEKDGLWKVYWSNVKLDTKGYNKKGKKITVEVDNLNQLKKIIGLKFNRVLFDNNLNFSTTLKKTGPS